MTVEECGKRNGKTLLLLPGTGCCAKANFKTVLPLLEQEYHLILVDYDGFDGRGGTFSSMEKQTEKKMFLALYPEEWLKEMNSCLQEVYE